MYMIAYECTAGRLILRRCGQNQNTCRLTVWRTTNLQLRPAQPATSGLSALDHIVLRKSTASCDCMIRVPLQPRFSREDSLSTGARSCCTRENRFIVDDGNTSRTNPCPQILFPIPTQPVRNRYISSLAATAIARYSFQWIYVGGASS